MYFASMYSRRPHRPPSRPSPERFTPQRGPQGPKPVRWGSGPKLTGTPLPHGLLPQGHSG